eukprot:9186341-Heterocapsa_arctica.AAC.1
MTSPGPGRSRPGGQPATPRRASHVLARLPKPSRGRFRGSTAEPPAGVQQPICGRVAAVAPGSSAEAPRHPFLWK